MIYKFSFTPFLKRIIKPILIILIAYVVLLMVVDNSLINMTVLSILFLFFIAITVNKHKTYIEEIKLSESWIELSGHHFNGKSFYEKIPTSNIRIQLTSGGRREFKIKIYNKKKILFSQYKTGKWTFSKMAELIIKVKEIKNEKITYDDKYLLEDMKKWDKNIMNWLKTSTS